MFIAVDESFPEHPKTLRFCAALQFEHAWCYLIKLWRWAMKYAKDGELSRFEPIEIEYAVGWRGDEGKLYAAAVRAGFIDSDDSGHRIHDWDEHQGRWVKASTQAKDRMAAMRLRRSTGEVSVDPRYAERSHHPTNVTFASPPMRGEVSESDLPPCCDPALSSDPDPEQQQPRQRRKNVRVGYSAAFEAIWLSYPNGAGKSKAWEAWKKHVEEFADTGNCDLASAEAYLRDLVSSALGWQLLSDDWTRDGGKFVPHFATYLNHRRWEDRPNARATSPPLMNPETLGVLEQFVARGE